MEVEKKCKISAQYLQSYSARPKVTLTRGVNTTFYSDSDMDKGCEYNIFSDSDMDKEFEYNIL